VWPLDKVDTCRFLQCFAIVVLLTMQNDLPHAFIDIKAVVISFHNRLQSCVAAASGHSEHSSVITSQLPTLTIYR